MSSAQVVVFGPGARRIADELTSAGIVDVAVLDPAPTAAVFDESTDTWSLRTAAAEVRAGAVVTTAPPLTPWIPAIAGRNDFHGVSFHAARWPADFDPAGKHVAVIGGDSVAADRLGPLTAAAASVTVFAHPPRRIVTELPLPATRIKRWLIRRTQAAFGATPSRPASVTAPISALTPRGIRTGLAAPGVEHRVDAIVFGTGFTADQASELVGTGGVRIAASWRDGAEPFLGIAIHGFPNYFCLAGPDIETQTHYIVECLTLMKRTRSTRIEVLGSSMQVFNERAHLRPAVPATRLVKAFDLSSAAPADDDVYDGAATLAVEGAVVPVRVRLTGRLDPIDGLYHWQGTLFGSPGHPLPDELLKQNRAATLSVGDRSAAARMVERTPWGTHSIAGVGAPPYAMTRA
ncbi:monooxygenase [Mycobacterium sherrisii]|nr:monooxygenase [Mycobacterium sherrisii]